MLITRGNPYTINALSFLWATLTIPALYLAGRKLLSPTAGLLAAVVALLSSFLDHAAVPPLLFPLPLVSLGFIAIASGYPGTHQGHPDERGHLAQRSHFKAIMLGTLTGLALHLHFSGVFLFPLLVPFGWRSLLPVLAAISPLALFDLRHHGMIITSALEFIRGTPGPPSLISYRIDTFLKSLTGILIPGHLPLLLKLGTIAVLLWSLTQRPLRWPLMLISTTLIFFLAYGGNLIPYYGILAWAPFLLMIGEFLASVTRSPTGLLAVALWFGWMVGKNAPVWLAPTEGRTLDKKIAALEFMKHDAGDRPFYLSKTMDLAADHGFTYLTDYLELNLTDHPVDPTYTLIAPYNYLGIEPDLRFGDFGVVLPDESRDR